MAIILFRQSEDMVEEYAALLKTEWEVYTRFLSLPPNELVVGRYSVLPFYREVEEELELIQCKLVNSYKQHRYIADIENWYNDLSMYTPKTWFRWDNLPKDMSFVVKGRTNSRKFNWNRQMFAETREDLSRVIYSLMDDSLVRDQGVCIREYVPLHRYDTAINGLPITNEWRVFFYQNKILAGGYYWSNYEECAPYEFKDLPKEAYRLLADVSQIVAAHTNFYVVDIAETAGGNWIVIELNDGQQSGLSMIDPIEMYTSLYQCLR
jgi:hypothetical protein